MCGIYARVSNEPFELKDFVKKAKLLEYRGYDSYGYLYEGEIGTGVNKFLGEVDLSKVPNISTRKAIFHCRWNSVGVSSIDNTHPIYRKEKFGSTYVVHNGTLTNSFSSSIPGETDTRLIAEKLHEYFIHINTLYNIYDYLTGTFAVVSYNERYDYFLAFAKDMPLYFNKYGEVCSDSSLIKDSFQIKEREFVFLDPFSDIYCISNNSRRFINLKPKEPEIIEIKNNVMLDEIKEQSSLVKENLELLNIEKPNKIVLFGMGSSYNAALLGRRYFSSISKVKNIEVDYSTEFDYNNLDKETLYIGITQSGHTKDTLDVFVNLHKYNTVCITNNLHSPCATLAKHVIDIKAQKETVVVATKSHTMTCLALLKQAHKWANKSFSEVDLSKAIDTALCINTNILSEKLAKYNNILVLGSQHFYPIACEIALKLKESCYINAEAMLGSQLKHGSLCICDDKTYLLFLMSKEEEIDKYVNMNISQVLCRKGNVFTLGRNNEGVEFIDYEYLDKNLNPLIVNILGQKIAAEIAEIKGINSSRPRFLSKSITVN